jgi:hypothetical protein
LNLYDFQFILVFFDSGAFATNDAKMLSVSTISARLFLSYMTTLQALGEFL